jgi:hypothetical protein
VSGFGHYPFGGGPFGSFDWAKQVLFRDLPEIDRRLDAEDPDAPLETWADSCKPLFDELLTFAREFETLRDPDYVRTQFQDQIAVTLLSAAVDESGRTVRVTVDDPDPNDPLVPLGRTSVGWILIDADGREFTVNQVHKLSNDIIIKGNILPTTGASPTGDAIIRPPSLIELFGEDFGVTIDRHDPEVFQRSMVRNAWQLYGMKGSEKGYEVVGKMAGYDVVALPLWRVNPVPDGVPSAHIYELPVGSGKYYTDYPPTRPNFDEVAADVVPVDLFCWEEPDWTTDTITPPPGPLPDGTPVQEAIGSYTQGLSITSTTDLGGGRWRITVNGGADLWPIAAFGQWYATFTDVGAIAGQLFLEDDPVDIGGGSWTFEVLAGTAPTFGTTVDLDYECQEETSCSYCKASLIRIEVRPTEILNEPDALLDGILERLRDRILAIVPIHVRLADIVHIVEVTVAVGVAGQHLIVTGDQQRALFAYAGVGFYFDHFAGDILVVDPAHMVSIPTLVVSGTGDNIGGAAPAMTLSDAAGGFAPWMVGKNITIAGATTGTNNGTFLVTSYVSPTQIGYTNGAGVAEPFPGTWSVST